MTPANRKPVDAIRRPELLILLALIATLAVELVVWRSRHRSSDELWRNYQTGTSSERVEALFVLTNRDQPQGFDQRFVEELLRSEQVALRELAMTHSLTRHSGTKAQEDYLESSRPSRDEVIRCRFFLRFEERQFRRGALRRYFEARRHMTAAP